MWTSYAIGSPMPLGERLTFLGISAFTRDIANEFVTGKSYNDLDDETFASGLSFASAGAGVFWRTTKHFRWFGPTIRAVPVGWMARIADPATQEFLQFLQVWKT
jgi:hypothetical protein